MLSLGAFAFTTPWILAALATLPVVWWLLRVTPPAPKLMAFPPIRLLMALRPREETPARTPLWLVLLRMTLAALIIVALAGPLLNPGAALRGSGPLIVVVDNGWASARNWSARRTVLEALIDRAARQKRPVRLMTTARRPAGDPMLLSEVLRPAAARERARAIAPRPWPTDRAAALAALTDIEIAGSAHVAWLSDGLDGPGAQALAERLQEFGSLEVYTEPGAALPRLVRAPDSRADGLDVPILRANARAPDRLWLRATGEDGRLLARKEVTFKAGAARAVARIALPGELRNAVTQLTIEGETTAGASVLVDERWRRRPVGLASGETDETAQPLLSSLYYLERALKPFSEVRRGKIDELLRREIAVVILADIGKVSDSQSRRLANWLSRGGVIVRFAGPKLAKTTDELVPVQLRGGGRALGGAMSWSRPANLAPFDATSPFNGIKVPGEVEIRRQVLAEPSLELASKTWARLTDGTPLITGERRERGWLVLVHTTANTAWSNLPISGLFVEMLRRVVRLSQGVVSDDGTAVLPPLETLDAMGRLGTPPASAAAITGRELATAQAGPRTPPGFYGLGGARRALNLSAGLSAPAPLGPLPAGVLRAAYDAGPVIDFTPWLLLAALILLLADLIISFALRGMLPIRAAVAAVLAALVALPLLTDPGPAMAQTPPANAETIPTGPDARALMATLKTRLAFIVTGDPKLDEISRAGLTGLTKVLRRRTAVEPGAPMAVDIESDELAFFPLLYWPVTTRQRVPSERAVVKLNQYLRSGGTILFDTREQGNFASDPFGGGGRVGQHLRRLMRGLDVPTLIPVPDDHVLTKSFYLLSEFPGRWTGGTVWVERRGGRHNDGVSSVIIGAHDWASAWAADNFGNAMFAVVPGGELQREMAYRVGVNWVMYALTGNYKTDQVHVPAIIERLGQ